MGKCWRGFRRLILGKREDELLNIERSWRFIRRQNGRKSRKINKKLDALHREMVDEMNLALFPNGREQVVSELEERIHDMNGRRLDEERQDSEGCC